MENILRKEGYNVKNVRDVLFVPVENVVIIPERAYPTELTDSSSIILQDIDGWYYFRFTPFSCTWSEEKVNVNGEVLYEQSLKMFVPKQNMNRFLSFEDMERRRFIVLIRDFNNFSVIGGYQQLDGEIVGMQYKEKFSTNPVNGYQCEFYLQSRRKAAAGYNLQDNTVIVEPPWPVNPDGGAVIVPTDPLPE
jgi:hypothetical protein